jgi:Holliday junction resolvase
MKTHTENWMVIAECNSIYHISDYGRVKSYKCGKERILKATLTSNGYAAVKICANGKRKIHKIHRLVASAFLQNPENKPQVNHKDGNKANNHVDNLEWTTHKENIQHAWQTGLCESKRLATSKAKSKPVVDIVTGTKYKSLINACKDINEPYSRHLMRIFQKSQNQRFFFVN